MIEKECCATCKLNLSLESWDYGKVQSGEPWKYQMAGFVCNLFADEGLAIWRQDDPWHGMCECWMPKEGSNEND